MNGPKTNLSGKKFAGAGPFLLQFLASFSVEQGGECKQADESSSVSRSVLMTQDKKGHVCVKEGITVLSFKEVFLFTESRPDIGKLERKENIVQG